MRTVVIVLLILGTLALQANAANQVLSTTISGVFSTPVSTQISFSKPDAALDTNDKTVSVHFLGSAEATVTTSSCADIDGAIPTAYVPNLGSQPFYVNSLIIKYAGAETRGAIYVTENSGSYFMRICNDIGDTSFGAGTDFGLMNTAITWNIA